METTGYKHAGLREKITGRAMKVRRYFGLGPPEVLCQRALVVERERRNVKCRAEAAKEIDYGKRCLAKRRSELFVEDKAFVELKQSQNLTKAGITKSTIICGQLLSKSDYY